MMRPITKKKPGDIIEYKTSMDRLVVHTIKDIYNPYGDAKDPLVANLGKFCSYCEEYRAIGDMHVEHIIPKGKGGDEYAWDNFLLACNICNSCKLLSIADINTTHFPHQNNTFLDFIYDESGRVKINPELPEHEYKKAENLYNLIKLGRGPQDKEAATERDYRWQNRFETWNIAKRKLELYASGKIDIKDIMDLVLSRGNWSIWFTVFKEYNDVRRALITQIPGTCIDCFDESNQYEPIL